MRGVSYLLLLTGLLAFGCAGGRLSHDEARKRIAEIGTSTAVPGSIEIRRIVSQNDTSAIAETTVTLAFQFKKEKPSNQWRVAAVRLDDRDWISLDELIAAVNDGRRRETVKLMEKLADGIVAYRQRNGSLPNATDVVKLTDILHPQYMTELVRLDAWGHPIQYESTGADFHVMSAGPDGRFGTPDDVRVP
jgi:type II secretion system (T2SS) protein G